MYRFFEWVRVYIVAALLVGGNKSLLGELPLTGLINLIIILILTVQLWIEINFEISLTDERFHQKFERDQSHSFSLHRNEGAHLHHLVRSSYLSFLLICYLVFIQIYVLQFIMINMSFIRQLIHFQPYDKSQDSK